MSAYLDLAYRVLKQVREPLRAKAILKLAYTSEIVPSHLFGKTQQKTLQARLSEDILKRRENSLFFRTESGVFFLREFITDETIPDKYKVPLTARRRVRDLTTAPALSFNLECNTAINLENISTNPEFLLSLVDTDCVEYKNYKAASKKNLFIWSFVIVRSDTRVLCYRQGKYREHNDTFLNKRTIGFKSLVYETHKTIFNRENHGILESGIDAVTTDLDIPFDKFNDAGNNFEAALETFLHVWTEELQDSILAVIEFQCPSWFEPSKKRLSLNNLHWIDFSRPPNNISDFDPWSRAVINNYFDTIVN